MNKHHQQGVGLMEVLIALLILAIGILGFSALQLRALDASQEATERSVAMNIARDLAERIRVNRTGLAAYKTAINSKTSNTTCTGTTSRTGLPATKKVDVPKCASTTMAQYDATEVLEKATENGQTVIMADCVGSTLSCVYVAWADTTITASDISKCVNTTTGTYIANSKCLVMEVF